MAWVVSAAVGYVAAAVGATVASAGAIALAGTAISGALIVSASYAIGQVVALYALREVSKAIAGGAPQQSTSAARAQGILLNTTSNVEGLPVIYGTRKVGGNRIAPPMVSGADNGYLHLFIALGEGECTAVTEVYIDDVAVGTGTLTTAAPSFEAAAGQFAGVCRVEFFSGLDTQAACTTAIGALGGVWTTAHKGSGVAYLYLRLYYTPTAYSGLPTITADVMGRKVYDPRENLLTNSFTPNTWAGFDDATGTHTTSVVADPVYGQVVRITKTAGANGVRVGMGIAVAGLSGNDYTTSIYCKTNVAASTGSSTYVDAAKVGGGLVTVTTPVSGTVGAWARATASAVGPLAGSANFYVLMSGPIGSSIDIAMPQLNLGPTALPYTPTTTTAVTPTTAHTRNPALCIYDYLTNARYGKGLSASVVDVDSIIESANYCDQLVTIPGGTQKRYTCDGVVDINASALDNIKSLLTSCRGLLVYSGGTYKLLVDQVAAPGFEFNEDNIVGGWSIVQPGRRSKYNRVTAGFFNPAASWQPDLGISDSPAYRVQDNGLLLEDKIDLPFTANAYTAQQLAGLHLKQSRFGLTAHFTAMQSALRCEIGDVVTVTHTTPGWVAKPFKVLELELRNDDEVGVVLMEYDDSVYVLETLTEITGADTTTLPDVFNVAPPGTPSVVEDLYQTTGSAGVKSRATMAWSAAPDVLVQGYWPEYKLAADTAWTKLPRTADVSTAVPDLAPATYHFRVRAENAIGALSAYTPTTIKELQGLTAPPADITGFYVTKVGGLAVAEWSLVPDLDVRIGGRVVIRHSPQTTVATWADGIILNEFAGDTVTATLPLMTGTYMAKAKDSTDNYSNNMTAFVATAGLVTGFTTVATSTQHPAFAGAKTNTAVVSGGLQLDGTLLFDSAAGLFDATSGSFDVQGGLSPTGSYAFDTYTDLATVATRRLEASIKVYSFDTANLFDDRTGLFDAGGTDFDGTAINDCDATLYYSTTDTDPAGAPVWGPWTPFFVADVSCRAVRFKLDFLSANTTHNIACTTLAVHIKTSP